MKNNKVSWKISRDHRLLSFLILSIADVVITGIFLFLLFHWGHDLSEHKSQLIATGIVAGVSHLVLIAFSVYGRIYANEIHSEEIQDRTKFAYTMHIYLWIFAFPVLITYYAYRRSGGSKAIIQRAMIRYRKNHILEYLKLKDVKEAVAASKDTQIKIDNSILLQEEGSISVEERDTYVLELLNELNVKLPEVNVYDDEQTIIEIQEIIESY